jgi:hypothetical protein
VEDDFSHFLPQTTRTTQKSGEGPPQSKTLAFLNVQTCSCTLNRIAGEQKPGLNGYQAGLRRNEGGQAQGMDCITCRAPKSRRFQSRASSIFESPASS